MKNNLNIQQIKQVPPDSSSNISWLKTLSIGFGLVSFGITIGIIGFILGTRQDKQTIQPQQIKLSPTISQPSPTLDPTESWKTYTNTKYQFTLDYPIKFILSEDNKIENYYDNLTQMKKDSGEIISIKAIYNIDVYNNASPKVVAEREIMDSGFKYSIEKKTIGVYNTSITKIESNPKSLIFIIAHPQKNLFIEIKLSREIQNFDQILQTFKFTDQ